MSLESFTFVNAHTAQIMWPTEIYLSTRYVDLIQKQRIKIREFLKVFMLFNVCNTEYTKNKFYYFKLKVTDFFTK